MHNADNKENWETKVIFVHISVSRLGYNPLSDTLIFYVQKDILWELLSEVVQLNLCSLI